MMIYVKDVDCDKILNDAFEEKVLCKYKQMIRENFAFYGIITSSNEINLLSKFLEGNQGS